MNSKIKRNIIMFFSLLALIDFAEFMVIKRREEQYCGSCSFKKLKIP